MAVSKCFPQCNSCLIADIANPPASGPTCSHAVRGHSCVPPTCTSEPGSVAAPHAESRGAAFPGIMGGGMRRMARNAGCASLSAHRSGRLSLPLSAARSSPTALMSRLESSSARAWWPRSDGCALQAKDGEV